MKTITYAAIASLALFLSSCDAVDKLFTFNMSNQTSFKIEPTILLDTPSYIATADVTTNSSSEFSNNNTRVDLIKSVKLDELKLTITDPADQTFKFLKSVHLYISTDANDEIELAYADNINATSNTLNLSLTSADLAKFVKASSFKIRTKVTTKESVSKTTTIQADLKYKVTADPF